MAKTPTIKPKYIGRKNAAQYIGASVQLIDKMIRDGKLQRFKLGDRKVVLLLSEVEQLVEAQ